MQGNHENQNLFFELTTFFFPAKKNLVGNLQIYGILLLTRKRNFKNVDNTFGTNHSTRKTQSKNFLIFYVLHKIGIFKDAAEQLPHMIEKKTPTSFSDVEIFIVPS